MASLADTNWDRRSTLDFLDLVGPIVAIGGLLWTYFCFIVKIKEDIASLKVKTQIVDDVNEVIKKVNDQGERITRLETKMDPFWQLIQGRVAQMLKAPTHLRKDALLDKLTEQIISLDEAKELKTILMTEVEDHNDNLGLTLGYILVLTRIEQIILGVA